MKKHLLMTLIIILIMIISGCSTGSSVSSSISSTATPYLMPTETPTNTPTTESSDSSTPTSMPTVTENNEGEILDRINSNIKDFLNKKGACTDSQIKEELFTSSEYPIKLKELGLGDTELLQGMLLGHFQKDQSVVMVVGLKDKSGERFITGIDIPVYFYNVLDSGQNFSFLSSSDGQGMGWPNR